MGSYCELTIADKSICWKKNSVDPVMMSIFSAQDKQYRYEKISEVFPEDFEEDDETPYAICKYISRVSVVKKRLDILGFSLIECEKSLKACVDAEIEYFEQYLANNDNDDLLFELYTNDKNTLSVANVESFVNAYKTIFKLTNDLVDAENKFRDSGGLLGYVTNSTNEYAFGIPVNDFRFSLRILLECFEEDAPVELDLSDLIAGGWYA